MSRYQRRKGHNFERRVARRFREVLGEAHRGWQAREDHREADVNAAPFHVECKIGKRPPYRKALEQAESTCPKGYYPVAVCKLDRDPATVTMRLDDFLDLVGEWAEMRAK